MKNSDLKVVLQQMLDEGELDASTISMLQDASVHVAMKLDLPLEGIALTYYILAAGHQLMKDLLGVDMSKMDVMGGKPDLTSGLEDLLLGTPPVSLDDALTGRETNRKMSDDARRERETLNAILKDLNIEL